MRVLSTMTWLVVFVFSMNLASAQEPSCCDQLRQEVQVLKAQQDKLFKELKEEEVNAKKSFSGLEGLMGVLSTNFPQLKDSLKKFKDLYDHLGKATNAA